MHSVELSSLDAADLCCTSNQRNDAGVGAAFVFPRNNVVPRCFADVSVDDGRSDLLLHSIPVGFPTMCPLSSYHILLLFITSLRVSMPQYNPICMST